MIISIDSEKLLYITQHLFVKLGKLRIKDMGFYSGTALIEK
jgi:hypothetical protein